MIKMKVLSTVLFFMAFSGIIQAHGVNLETSFQGKTVVLMSSFSPSQPLADAVVTVYSPADADNIWQRGRTDKTGHFAFMPDSAGDWVFIVDDEKGHMKRIVIEVPADLLSAEQPEEESGGTDEIAGVTVMNKLQKALIGLSLIFGLTGIFYGLRARKNQKQS